MHMNTEVILNDVRNMSEEKYSEPSVETISAEVEYLRTRRSLDKNNIKKVI